MAATAAGQALTTAYRAQQLAIQAGSLRQLLVLWQAVDVTALSDTIEIFAQAAALLAAQGYADSGASAVNYYGLFRRVEVGASGAGIAIPAAPTVASMAGDLRGAALSGIINGRRAGMGPAAAAKNGLVKVVGTLGKLVLAGGRATILGAVQRDRTAQGWSRATSGDPCSFCRMLAGRGPVYKSSRSAGFEPHDHCSCTAEPYFKGESKALDGRADRFENEYLTAQRWAAETGTQSAGTANNALNNYRRWLDSGSPDVSR